MTSLGCSKQGEEGRRNSSVDVDQCDRELKAGEGGRGQARAAQCRQEVRCCRRVV